MDHILIPKINDVLLFNNALFDQAISYTVNVYITTTHLIISNVNIDKELWILHSMIDHVELLPLDIKGCPILIRCKNFQNIILVLQKDSERFDFYQTLLNLSKPNFIEDLPLFHNVNPIYYKEVFSFDLENEYIRMGVNVSKWIKTNLNKNFQLCDTYPEVLFVPRNTQTQTVLAASKFRSKNRIPTLTYIDKNGCALCRSSQPLSGLNARCLEDENLMTDILFSNSNFDNFLLHDTEDILATSTIDSQLPANTSLHSRFVGESCFQTSNCPTQADVTKGSYFEGPNPFSYDSNVDTDNSIATIDGCLTRIVEESQKLEPPAASSDSAYNKRVQPFNSIKKSIIPYMYIVDTRPKINALANRAKGAGGYENPNFYTNVKFKFCSVENIHVMRNSLAKLIKACQSKWDTMSNFLNALHSTGWCKHIRAILSSSLLVAQILREEEVNVLVHCSDGWDRTAQTVSIAQLLLDPYYRTLKGYITLIEKDWLAFGHKFSDRCGHLNGDKKEVSPVFLQFLDCTWQLTQMFPSAFQFNEHLLLRLLDGVYSCDTSTFLGNSPKWRKITLEPLIETKSKLGAPQLWNQILQETNNSFRNPFYKSSVSISPSPPHNSIPQDCFNSENNPNTHAFTNLFLKPNLCPQNIKIWLGAYARFDENMHPKIDLTRLLTNKLDTIDKLQKEFDILQMRFEKSQATRDNTDENFISLDGVENDENDEIVKNVSIVMKDNILLNTKSYPNGYDPLINNQI